MFLLFVLKKTITLNEDCNFQTSKGCKNLLNYSLLESYSMCVDWNRPNFFLENRISLICD